MKTLKEMEEAADNLTALLCTSIIVILIICIVVTVLQLIIGFMVSISLGG